MGQNLKRNGILHVLLFAVVGLLTGCITADYELEIIRAGVYSSFFESESEAGANLGKNTVNADGTGIYEWYASDCEVYIEEYTWEVPDSVLIINNFHNYYYDSCFGTILEEYEPYTQYFEILTYSPETVVFGKQTNVYEDGSWEIFEDDEPYIWQYIGQ